MGQLNMSKELKGNRLEVIGYTGKNNGDRTMIEVTDADFADQDILKATLLVEKCKFVDVQGTGKFYNADIDSSDSVKLYATKENSETLTILTNGNPQPVIVTLVGGPDDEPSEGYIPAQF